MKTLICTLIFLIPLAILHGETIDPIAPLEADSTELTPKNAIMIAPLGHILNESKSSIYYKRVLNHRKKYQVVFRIGTEGLGSALSSYSVDASKVDAFNLKLGLELDIDFGEFHIFAGPELGQTTYSSSHGLLRVRENNTLFSTSSVAINRDIEVNSSEVRMVSGHIFFGLKFEVAEKVAIGIEAAFGYGQWTLETEYPNAMNPVTDEGERYDFNLSRFIFAEFKF